MDAQRPFEPRWASRDEHMLDEFQPKSSVQTTADSWT